MEINQCGIGKLKEAYMFDKEIWIVLKIDKENIF